MEKYFQFNASGSRMLAGFTGPVLLGLGLGISISAGFGSFGFSVLLDGLHQTFAIPLWLSQSLMTLCFYGIAWKWAGIPLGIGSLPTLLLIGPAISVGATLTPVDYLFVGNLLSFIVGLIVFSLGISLSAAAALGPDGVTALSLRDRAMGHAGAIISAFGEPAYEKVKILRHAGAITAQNPAAIGQAIADVLGTPA